MVAATCVLALLASCGTTPARLDINALDAPADATLVPCEIAKDMHGRPVFNPLGSPPEEGTYMMVAFKDKQALTAYDIEIVNDKSNNPLKPLGYLGGAILLAIPIGIAVGFSFMCTQDPDDPDEDDCDEEDTDDQFKTGFAVGVVGTLAWGIYMFVDESRKLFVNNTERVRAHTSYRYDTLGRLSHIMVTPFGDRGAYSSVKFLYNGSSPDPFDREAFSYNTDPRYKDMDSRDMNPNYFFKPSGQ